MTDRARVLALVLLSVAGAAAGEAARLDIAADERIALIGDSLFEVDRSLGHLELRLQRAAPERARTLRNLGCSGDQVDSRARLNGMRGLIANLEEFKPTTVIIHYGANDAAAGAAGVDTFTAGLTTLLGEVRKHAKQVLVLVPRLPPEATAYGDTLRRVAGAGAITPWATAPAAPVAGALPVLLDESAAIAAAMAVERALGLSAPAWSVRVEGGAGRGEDAIVAEVAVTPAAVRFTATATVLPDEAATGTLTVIGLAAGRWSVRIDGAEAVVADAADLAKGLRLVISPDRAQAGELRRAIVAKNQLFSRQWHPQNTHVASVKYIKADFANYDSLITAQDHRIDGLRLPIARRFELTPVRN